MVKNPLASAGDTGSIPGSGRSLGRGNGNPLQYFCLENPMDRGVLRASVYGVSKEPGTTKKTEHTGRIKEFASVAYGWQHLESVNYAIWNPPPIWELMQRCFSNLWKRCLPCLFHPIILTSSWKLVPCKTVFLKCSPMICHLSKVRHSVTFVMSTVST